MNTVRTIIRVSDQMGWELAIKSVQNKKDMRLADYGNDGRGDSPIWIAVDRLVDADQYSQEQLERWGACGRLDL